jgi:hypothetical protein
MRSVATELGIYVHGEPGEIDAGKVLDGLRHVLDLLRSLEDATIDNQHGRSTWRFTNLALDSIDAGVAVLEPRPGVSDEDIADVVQSAVDGLALTESQAELPTRWNRAVAVAARKAAETLGTVTGRGAQFTMRRDGHTVTRAEVTIQCAQNITTAISPRRRSLGSVIGTLEAVTVHDRREAGLWTESGQHRVAVKFRPELLESVGAGLGKRVEATGVLWRDFEGLPVRLDLRRLTVLRSRTESPALTELLGTWTSGPA